MVRQTPLPSPRQIQEELPLQPNERAFIAEARLKGKQILEKKIPQLAAFVGPCSIHDTQSAIEYALRLQNLSLDIHNSLFLIMRLFVEKPRTQLGWKGLLYDPYLDGSHNIAEGIRRSRKLLLRMAELRIPCACELLDPLIIHYFSDLVSWGFVGARTSASSIHRQLASGLPFPVGFKNSVHGEVDVAIAAVLAAKNHHCHISLNEEGQICSITTPGNPWTHITLRGSATETNFQPELVDQVIKLLKHQELDPRVLIDCSHGNSNKNPIRQKIALKSVIEQSMQDNSPIIGFMLESHLFPGRQKLPKNPQDLSYGISITDSCLGWEETEEWLRWADFALSGLSLINSTQK